MVRDFRICSFDDNFITLNRYLVFYPNGNAMTRIGLKLEESADTVQFDVKYRFGIIKAGKTIFTGSESKKSSQEFKVSDNQTEKFMGHDKLFNPKNGYISQLTVICEVRKSYYLSYEKHFKSGFR